MRLTYRTVRTLEAIAVVPGANNREIGERVGIVDQGQISKLLSRLAGLGLIENTGLGQAGGAANAWHLTPSGTRLESAIRRKAALA
jgi:DNA-binding MarR family transcriptional regulator